MCSASEQEESLFSAALSLPVWERERYIARACAGDEQLQSRLIALLRVVDSGRVPSGLPFGARAEITGDNIADYKLLEEIGEGGCGVVYRAEQVGPVRREVALKIVKIGMDSAAVMARFEAERQVLALMDHPGIAKVLDAGTTGSGRPYFVMELVRGIRITEYCSQLRLNIRDRVMLLTQVCQAIEHAHSRGIVHRDIKPSNVLVTLVDGAPAVKVIDFGIAKATQGRLTRETLLTELEQFIGTPAYVSPEQIEPGTAGIDQRSDVYSLGVLLYELLTGCLPFDSDSLPAPGAASLCERIRSEEPVKPSKRFAALPLREAEVVASERGADVVRLSHEVRGDLDCIALRCLEKAPERRFQTANDLNLDLRRYLCHEPIAARPAELTYRFAKFARRHRVGVSAAGTVLVVVVVAAVMSAPTVMRLTNAGRVIRELATYARSVAPQDRVDELASLDSPAEGSVNSRSRQMEARALRVAPTHERLAASYRWLGDTVNEDLNMEEALAIYEREGRRGDVLRLLRSWATWLARQGRYAEAERKGGVALRTQHAHGGAIDSALAAVMGFVYVKQGKVAEAKALLEPVVERKRLPSVPDGSEALEVMKVLAAVYAIQGRQVEAERLARTVVLNHRRTYGPSYPETVRSMYVLADIYARGGNFSAATSVLVEGIYQQSLKRTWWKTCDCPEEPRPRVDPLRPLQCEQGIVGGILDLRGTPIPSPLEGCNCEPMMMQHPDLGDLKAPLVMSD